MFVNVGQCSSIVKLRRGSVIVWGINNVIQPPITVTVHQGFEMLVDVRHWSSMFVNVRECSSMFVDIRQCPLTIVNVR